MGRDLISRPYGRFYHLAKELASQGHEVQLLLCSYQANDSEIKKYDELNVESVSIPPLFIPVWLAAKKRAIDFQPDWIFGFSDTWYGILAAALGRRYGAKVLIDAYDNFEAYIPWALPLHRFWRYALDSADVVTCAGQALAELLGQSCSENKIKIIPMTADTEVLTTAKKSECRQKLNLEQNNILVGCHGSLYQTRGVDTFFKAAALVCEKDKNIRFVTSGRVDKKTIIPDFINHLGYLSDQDVSYLLKSLDVLVVPNRDSSFGNYSYPVKVYEGMVAGLPMAVTRTRSTSEMFKHSTESLVEPENVQEMGQRILSATKISRKEYPYLPSWQELAIKLQSYLLDA